MTKLKEIQVHEKQAVDTPAEQTRPGLVFTPQVDIFETGRDITLLVDMPGVAKDSISIDLRDGVLTLIGDVRPWEGPEESDILVEFEIGKYYRQFTLTDVIDQDNLDAVLKDGVLRLTLPKTQRAVPRQIPVSTG